MSMTVPWLSYTILAPTKVSIIIWLANTERFAINWWNKLPTGTTACLPTTGQNLPANNAGKSARQTQDSFFLSFFLAPLPGFSFCSTSALFSTRVDFLPRASRRDCLIASLRSSTLCIKFFNHFLKYVYEKIIIYGQFLCRLRNQRVKKEKLFSFCSTSIQLAKKFDKGFSTRFLGGLYQGPQRSRLREALGKKSTKEAGTKEGEVEQKEKEAVKANSGLLLFVFFLGSLAWLLLLFTSPSLVPAPWWRAFAISTLSSPSIKFFNHFLLAIFPGLLCPGPFLIAQRAVPIRIKALH